MHPFAEVKPIDWYSFDLTFLAKCDILLVILLEGWAESKGVQMEINFAKMHNIPIFEVPPQAVRQTLDNLFAWHAWQHLHGGKGYENKLHSSWRS